MLRRISYDFLEYIFNKLRQRRKSKPLAKIDRICVANQDGFEFLDIGEIIYCKGDGNYTTFFLQGGKKTLATRSLLEYEKLLAGRTFFRTHKSFLVNLQYVCKYIKGRGGTLELKDGSFVEVSRNRKEQLLQKLVN